MKDKRSVSLQEHDKTMVQRDKAYIDDLFGNEKTRVWASNNMSELQKSASKCTNKIAEYLIQKKIDFIHRAPVLTRAGKMLFVQFFLPDKKIVIEFSDPDNISPRRLALEKTGNRILLFNYTSVLNDVFQKEIDRVILEKRFNDSVHSVPVSYPHKHRLDICNQYLNGLYLYDRIVIKCDNLAFIMLIKDYDIPQYEANNLGLQKFYQIKKAKGLAILPLFTGDTERLYPEDRGVVNALNERAMRVSEWEGTQVISV